MKNGVFFNDYYDFAIYVQKIHDLCKSPHGLSSTTTTLWQLYYNSDDYELHNSVLSNFKKFEFLNPIESVHSIRTEIILSKVLFLDLNTELIKIVFSGI
jgi:hypothetical protein